MKKNELKEDIAELAVSVNFFFFFKQLFSLSPNSTSFGAKKNICILFSRPLIYPHHACTHTTHSYTLYTYLQKRIDDLGDAEEEIMMVDESIPGSTKLMIGESFIDVDSSEATEFVNKELAAAKANKEKYEAQLATIIARQAELKKALYARFGKSINLEE
jgi:chaperonin cofactor prefoldin